MYDLDFSGLLYAGLILGLFAGGGIALLLVWLL